jgi:hypothetical protein
VKLEEKSRENVDLVVIGKDAMDVEAAKIQKQHLTDCQRWLQAMPSGFFPALMRPDSSSVFRSMITT